MARSTDIQTMSHSLEARVNAALRSLTPESSSLDYKLGLYERTEGGRKEFAKDIAGFANRNGGILILGVRERAGIPTEIVGLNPDEVDAAILWLESVARSGLLPHHPLIAIRALAYEGKSLAVVDVPKGFEQLYEVPSAGARFFVRDERSVRPMSREEIKFAVRREAELAERIHEFCVNSWAHFTRPDSASADRLSLNQCGCQLVVFPIFDGSFDLRFNLPEVAKKYPHRASFGLQGIGSCRAFIDGLAYWVSERDDKKFSGLVRLFRHGAIQISDGYVADFARTDEGKPRPLPGKWLMEGLVGSIKNAIKASNDITGASSFYIDFRMLTYSGQPIAFFNDRFGRQQYVTDRSHLIFDPITINLEDDWEARVPELCRPLLDQFWQAFGFQECGYFQTDGSYAYPS